MNWISVAERFPEKSGKVLVCLDYGGITVVNYSAKHKQFNNYDELPKEPENRYLFRSTVAWMPLPEPYKEGLND